MSAAEDLNATIDAALTELGKAAAEASVHEDPLQRPFQALACFLTALRQLYQDSTASLAARLEAARQPVRDNELRSAVISGISAHAMTAIQALNWRTSLYGALVGLFMTGVGFSGGALWQHRMAAAEIADAEAALANARETIIALNDGFGTALKARDAVTWLDLIRMNDIGRALRTCTPLKQDRGGSACAFALWTQLPPPATATPATH